MPGRRHPSAPPGRRAWRLPVPHLPSPPPHGDIPTVHRPGEIPGKNQILARSSRSSRETGSAAAPGHGFPPGIALTALAPVAISTTVQCTGTSLEDRVLTLSSPGKPLPALFLRRGWGRSAKRGRDGGCRRSVGVCHRCEARAGWGDGEEPSVGGWGEGRIWSVRLEPMHELQDAAQALPVMPRHLSGRDPALFSPFQPVFGDFGCGDGARRRGPARRFRQQHFSSRHVNWCSS